jgi:hypothetical protein
MTNLKSIIKPTSQWFGHNRMTVLRAGIIGIVLFSGAYLAPRIVLRQSRPTLLFLLFLGLVTFYILQRWPVLGIILAVVGGMFVKYEGPSGLNVSMLGVAFILGIWLLDMLIVRRSIKLVPSRTMLPLLIFVLISFVSFGIGQLNWFTFAQHAPINAQLGGLAIVIFSAGAFLATANLVRNLRWLETLTWTFITFGAFYVVGRLFHWGEIDRLFHPGFSSGSMFWTWLVALTFSQAAFNVHLHVRWRIVLGAILIATFFVAIYQAYDWKSGWLPPLVAAVAILAFRYWRKAWLLAPFMLLAAYNVVSSAISSDEYSYGTRLDAWNIVLNKIAKVDPLLGVGFANYYWYTPLFRIRGFSVRFNSHNQYVDLIAEIGIIGLAAFLWFFWEIGRLGWFLRERAPDGFARAYVYGALGGLVGTLFAGWLVDWVIPFVYNIGLYGFRSSVLPWIFLGGLVVIEQIVRQETHSQ